MHENMNIKEETFYWRPFFLQLRNSS